MRDGRAVILPAWVRKIPQVAEVLPLPYPPGLSTSDFAPALGSSSVPVVPTSCFQHSAEPALPAVGGCGATGPPCPKWQTFRKLLDGTRKPTAHPAGHSASLARTDRPERGLVCQGGVYPNLTSGSPSQERQIRVPFVISGQVFPNLLNLNLTVWVLAEGSGGNGWRVSGSGTCG